MFQLICFIEAAHYVIEPLNTLCGKGMIDNLSECQKVAKQLNIYFDGEENEKDFPGGCYVTGTLNYAKDDITNVGVYFNKNLKGASDKLSKPICGQGKYDKYISQFSCFDINDV